MKTINKHFQILILGVLAFTLINCSKDDSPPQTPVAIIEPTPVKEEPKLSDAKEITSFVFLLINNPMEVNVIATIDEENKTITADMPVGTIITGLLPTIEFSESATLDINTAQDFSDPLEYTLTAEDGSTSTYTVTVNTQLSQRQILQAIVDANPDNVLGWNLQNETDLSALNGVSTNTAGSITKLELQSKNLLSIPPEIGELVSLITLNLESNSLTLLPPEIGELTNLIRLDLGYNSLTSIPSEIGDLTNLLRLGLTDNQLTSLPLEIGSLTNLKSLFAGVNEFSTIPLEVFQLVELEKLSFLGNRLSSIPKEIGDLTNLTNLWLYLNQLTTLPPEIGFLISLETLEIGNNNIEFIPESIANLKLINNPEMRFIYDSDAEIQTISQLDALISIYSANPGNTLDWGVDNYPEITFNANGNPKTITMNNKNLTRIPFSTSKMSGLEVLNINGNNLTSLPRTLANINALTVIAAASNELNTVPSEFGSMRNLALLSITNNPILSIPIEVCGLQISNGGILTILTDPGEGCD